MSYSDIKRLAPHLCNEAEWEDIPFVPIKSRLKSALYFWDLLDKSGWATNLIKEGYVIPFLQKPQPAYFLNNKSALQEKTFVSEAILNLVKNGLAECVVEPPVVINALSVAIQASGKKRLILDLSPLNRFIRKRTFRCEDYSVALPYLEDAEFAYCFDLKSGYHHIDMHQSSMPFLGFCWPFNGKRVWFRFTVLCFGISSGPRIFTKLLKPLVTRWRAEGIKLVLYLDDGLGLANDRITADTQASRVRADLQLAGFCINDTKSVWSPSKTLCWLGVDIDLAAKQLTTPQVKRIKAIDTARSVIRKTYVTARQLASLTGKIINMRLILGNITVIGTKRLCRQILELLGPTANQWDRYNRVTKSTTHEIAFWLRTLLRPEVPRRLGGAQRPHFTVFSDASAVAAGAFIEHTTHKICKNFTSSQCKQSSAWRELMVVQLGLATWAIPLQGSRVTWFTDNQAITYIVKKGSMKSELNFLAAQILHTCNQQDIDFHLTWIPRKDNKLADAYSREFDRADWSISPSVFQQLDTSFGPHDFDRFASAENAKCTLFTSLNDEIGSFGVGAFNFDWGGFNNWVVPPPHLLAQTVLHMRACGASGTLLMPEWPSNPVWPLLMPNRQPAAFISKVLQFSPDIAVIPGVNDSLVTNGRLGASILAFRFQKTV